MVAISKSPSTDFTSTTLNGSINDSVTTITVNDASTINTPCYAVIDREDNNGVATPNQREVVYISGKSGNDLTVTRGVNNSTKRSHNDSAKFEPTITVGFWDDFYDAYDLDHNPADGSHDITKVAMLSGTTIQTLAGKIISSPTITSPTITLGSLTSTYISQATIGFSSLPTSSIGALSITTSAHASGASLVGFFPSGASGSFLTSIGNNIPPVFSTALSITTLFKVGSISRDMTASNGAVAYTGIGFQPKAVAFFSTLNGGADQRSSGVDDGTNAYSVITLGATDGYSATESIYIDTGSTVGQKAHITALGADGFTLTWTKSGSPGAGTAYAVFIACG